ncbi:hypothetical protein QTA57_08935 [Fontisubflavum oceani]|uniref:DUF6916 family protein n=1 Tax=Fontisubflavum oceani TaxID=2978973 RepID=UPI0025B29723|nr:hypothetical protein [Fontisubflavum oceani]WJY23172.1 hypothetical protein QTA57_08935 [Fontisubflavum oceani]
MDQDFTISDFQPQLKSPFSLVLGEKELALDLVEVTPKGQGARDGGAFALLWEGPLDPILDQGVYAMKSKALGQFEVFIVPVGQVDDVTQYEAVFT